MKIISDSVAFITGIQVLAVQLLLRYWWAHVYFRNCATANTPPRWVILADQIARPKCRLSAIESHFITADRSYIGCAITTKHTKRRRLNSEHFSVNT